jgi:hypothetical protein
MPKPTIPPTFAGGYITCVSSVAHGFEQSDASPLQRSLDDLNQTNGIDISIRQINDRVLSHSERAFLKNILLEARSELESLEGEISRTRALLASLLYERDRKTSRMEAIAAIVAPHKDLPYEVLSEIMVLAASGEEVYSPPTLRPGSTRWSPWALGRICSRWRQIALNEPRIWSRISLHDGCTLPNYMGVSQEAFRRSGQSPLSLSLSFRSMTHPSNPIHSFIAPNLGRISNLKLSGPPSFMTDFLSLPSSFIALESMCLECREPYWVPRGRIQIFEDASRLVDVGIRGCSTALREFPCNLNIQWARVTKICFSDTLICPSSVHKMLAECSQLRSCFIEVAGHWPEEHDPPYPAGSIRLPFLKYFSLTDPRTSGSPFLLPLDLPALSTLTIDGPFVRNVE